MAARLGPLHAAADRDDEEPEDGDRHQPPRAHVVVRDDGGESERENEARGDEPVVADDEVPPEAGEGDDATHVACGAGRRSRRSSRTSANDDERVERQETGIAASLPASEAPAPSAPQNVPKRRQHQPDCELERVLGHATQRRAHEDAGAGDDDEPRGAAPAASATLSLRSAAERDDDERDLEAFEQHAFEGDA